VIRGEFGEGSRELVSGVGFQSEFIVAAAEVLHEHAPDTDYADRAKSFQGRASVAAGLQSPLIDFDGIVRELLGDMARGRQ